MSTFATTELRYATPLTINSRERVVRSETLNLKTQSVGNDAQRWDLVITLEPATDNDDTSLGDLVGNALAVHRATKGLSESFTTKMPQYPGNNASHGDTLLSIVSAASADVQDYADNTAYKANDLVEFDSKFWRVVSDVASDNTDDPTPGVYWEELFSVSDSTINEAGGEYVYVEADQDLSMPPGRFITFSNHTKVYMVREIRTFDAALDKRLIRVFPPLVEDVEVNDQIEYDEPSITVYYAQDGVEGLTYTDGFIARATVSLVEALT